MIIIVFIELYCIIIHTMYEAFSNRPEAATPEHLVTDDTLNLVAGVGNHEMKALTLLFLGQYHEAFDRHGMDAGFRAWLSPASVWKPAPGIPFGYCEQSLEPIGQVVKNPVIGPRETTVSYYLSDLGHRTGLALAGLLLDWSLQYPEVSLQNVFGPTYSPHQARVMQYRLHVLAGLLTAPGGEASTAELAGPPSMVTDRKDYHTKLSNLDRASRGLERSGIVNAERVIQPDKTQYEILATDYPHKRPEPSHSPVVDALHDFIRACQDKNQRQFTYSECLDYITTDLEQAGGQLAGSAIKAQLTSALGGHSVQNNVQYRLVPGIKRSATFSAGHFTKVSLNETYRPALETLLNLVLAVDAHDAGLMEQGQALAWRISNDEQQKARLIAKAYRFSPAAKKLGRTGTSGQIVTNLATTTLALTTPALRQEPHDKFDTSLTPGSLKKLLGELAAKRLGLTGGAD